MFRTRFLILMGGLGVYALGFFLYFHWQEYDSEADFLHHRESYSQSQLSLVSASKLTPLPNSIPLTAPAVDTNAAPTSVSLPDASVPSLPTPSPDSGGALQAIPPLNPTISVPPMISPSQSNAIPLPAPDATSTNTMVQPHLPGGFLGKSLPARAVIKSLPALPSNLTTTNAAPVTNGMATPATNSAPLTNGAPMFTTNNPTGEPLRAVAIQSSAIILCYHRFIAPGTPSKNVYKMQADHFEAEMKYLHDYGYHVVPLADVVKFVKGQIGLPPRAVAITIDDGFKSVIDFAAPILKKYNYPWTFFCYPQFITTNESVGACSWKDLLQLQADGVDIESHSMTHPFLTRRMGKSDDQYDAWLTTETSGSKAELEQKLGKPVPFFAYPFGDYNKRVEAKAIAAGYEAIFTVADNPIHPTTPLSSMGRYVITTPEEKNFAAYLRQGALTVSEQNPPPGATINQPRPIISAVLDYAGNLDPKSIEAEVKGYERVPCDYDPKTYTVRLYLQRDLVQHEVIITIRAKDSDTHQTMVSNWHFNYEPAGSEGGTNGLVNPSSTNIAPPIPSSPMTEGDETAPKSEGTKKTP